MARFFDSIRPDWADGYDRRAFTHDAIAALILSVLLIPQAMAYAQLAGLSPSAGLFTAMVAPIVYALIGRTAIVSMGPVALASLLVADATSGTGIAPATAAAIVAIESGLMLAALSLLRLGRIVNFVSEPVLLGFTAAAAVLIAASQIGGLAGIDAARSSTVQGAAVALWNGGGIVWGALLLGVAALAGFLFGGHMMRRVALRLRITGKGRLALLKSVQALVIVMAALVASLLLPDIARIEEPEGGLPPLSLPGAPVSVWVGLVVPSLILAIVIFVTGIAVSKSLASKRRTSVNSNAEALAIGAANIVAGVAGGYSAGVSLSRSALVDDAGAKTPLASAMAALIVLPVAWFGGPLLAQLPVAVLSALVISAIFGLVKLGEIREVMAHSRGEGLVIAITFLATVTLGVQWGLFAGAIAGIAAFLWSSSLPRITREGLERETEIEQIFRSVGRESVEGDTGEFLILRIDRPLYFGNVGYAEERVSRFVSDAPEAKCLILDMRAVTDVDATGLRMLTRLLDNIETTGLEVVFAALQRPVQEALDSQSQISKCESFDTVGEAVDRLCGRFDAGGSGVGRWKASEVGEG